MLEPILECPEFVYYNLPAKYASLAVTVPRRDIEIPENVVAEPRKDELSIRMRNNGAYGRYAEITNSDLLGAVKFMFGKDVYGILQGLTNTIWNEIPQEVFVDFLERTVETYFVSEVRPHIQNVIMQKGMVIPQNHDARMEIEGAFFRGDYFTFDEFVSLRQKVESELDFLWNLNPVPKNGYLYRAVQRSEWRQLLRDDAFLVRTDTNFESSFGPQVQLYAHNPDYAGRVIRIKVEGPFFRGAGMAVPRVTSVLPHYATHVEIFCDNDWVDSPDYMKL